MITTIKKEFHWEMGHRLPFHEGLCKNIHGHSYRAEIELTGPLNENGMVIDFYVLSQLVKPVIEELDHSFMVNDQDTLLTNFLEEHSFKATVVEFYTTAENIAGYLCDRIIKTLESIQHTIDLIAVTVWETEKASATVKKVIPEEHRQYLLFDSK
jgi:6-pyruvoyltetrahydropterin/6-carboxytetrahydropterin synthase